MLGRIGLLGALALFACAALNDLATRKRLTEASSASVRALNDADAAIRNADAITAMGTLPDLAQRWQDTTASSLDKQTAATDASGGISAAAKALRFGLQAAMLGVGGYLVIGNQMSAGSIVASAVIAARGLAPLEQLITSWRLFVGARAAYQRLAELLARAPAEAGGTVLPRPAGNVVFDKVNYVPPGVRLPIIRQISLWARSSPPPATCGSTGPTSPPGPTPTAGATWATCRRASSCSATPCATTSPAWARPATRMSWRPRSSPARTTSSWACRAATTPR